MDAWYELEIRTQIETLICKREAMKAENRERQGRGQADAYGEDAFNDLADQFDRLNDSIRNIG